MALEDSGNAPRLRFVPLATLISTYKFGLQRANVTLTLPGPVVRINPREVHIQDPDFLDELFFQRLDKDPWFCAAFGTPKSSFGTCDSNHHRLRRGAINKFFSKASIASRIPIIRKKILKLCDRLEQYNESGEVVHLDAAFICLTVDIISQFAFGVSYNYLGMYRSKAKPKKEVG